MNRRVHIAAPGRVEVRAVPEPPAPRRGQVLVRPEVVGICGSDLHVLSGRHPFARPPLDPGHEMVGRVAATGAGADTAPVGARVLLNPLVTCGRCEACRADRPMRCTRGGVMGFRLPGAMATSVLVDDRQLVAVPDGLAPQVAVLAEPLATAIRAVGLTGTPEHMVVLGGGTIGLLVALWARHIGAARVVVSEPVAARRELAVALGFEAHPPDALPADRVEAVVDCVAAGSTVAQAAERVRPGGTLVLVGVPAGDTVVPLADLQRTEVVLRGASMYGRAELRCALDTLAAGALTVDGLVRAVYPATDAARAFADAGRPASCKTLVSFS